MGALGGGAFSYARGTPVGVSGSVQAAVERKWHTQDSQGQQLALDFTERSPKPFELFPPRWTAATHRERVLTFVNLRNGGNLKNRPGVSPAVAAPPPHLPPHLTHALPTTPPPLQRSQPGVWGLGVMV